MSKSVGLSKFCDKWSRPVEKCGYTIVPNLLFEAASDIGLTSPELIVLIILMKYWWDKESEIFPSYATIANQAGISERTAARMIKQLADGDYIRIEHDEGRTNRYSLEPLVDLIDSIARSGSGTGQSGNGNPRHFVMGPNDKMTYDKDSNTRPP